MMSEYMSSLKNTVRYTSLKIKHAEKQAAMFPSPLGFQGEKSSEQEVESLWSMEEKYTDQSLTPLEEKVE